MDESAADLSIVIPTYNGINKIGKCIDSILSQTVQAEEIIVVIDGSTDGTESFLKDRYGEAIKTVVQKNQGRADSRNNGSAVAKGKFLLFVDDDMVLGSQSIQQHVTHHAKFSQSILVGGQYLKTNDANDFNRYRKSIENAWYRKLPGYPQRLQARNLFMTAANLSMSEGIFHELKGFRSGIKDCEDIEMGLRALNEDIDIYFNSEIIGWHHDPITCRQYIKRRREYNQAHMYLLEKIALYHNHYGEHKIAKGIKKQIYGLLSSKNLVRWIDLGRFFWIPRVVRYRFYSAVIWSLSKYYPNKVL